MPDLPNNLNVIDRVPSLRAFVVDDDPVYRHILARTIRDIPGVEFLGAAGGLELAKRKIEALHPDVVTIDVQLRNESGLDLVPWLARRFPGIVTVLLTAGFAGEARLAVEALLLGASALVLKPSGGNGAAELKTALLNVFTTVHDGQSERSRPPLPSAAAEAGPREVLAIGASTGGPPVIVEFLKSLDPGVELPVLIAQHMPAVHAPYFAELLARTSGRPVKLGGQGDPVRPGAVYLAGNDRHMRVARAGERLVIVEDAGPLVNQCRPAVDPLFISVAETCGRRAIGLVLSGMGVDGRQGALALRDRGAPVIVQDRESSIVWGMPGAVVAAGGATAVVSAGGLVAAVMARLGSPSRAGESCAS